MQMDNSPTFEQHLKLLSNIQNQKKIDEKKLTSFLKQISTYQKKNDEIINNLYSTVQSLENQTTMLKKEMQKIKIENVCLIHENNRLKSRIIDLVKIYPKAGILLGKTPHIQKKQKNCWFKKK